MHTDMPAAGKGLWTLDGIRGVIARVGVVFLPIAFILAGNVSSSHAALLDTGSWFLRAATPTPLLYTVVRGGELFVAAGEGTIDYGNGSWARSGAGAMRVSGDGARWIDLAGAASLPILRGVAYGTLRRDEEIYVVVGDGKTVLTSADGLVWQTGTLPVEISPTAAAYRCLDTEAVTGRCLGGIFVVVGGNGILTSPDGLSWTERKPTPAVQPANLFQSLKAVVFDGSHFVAVGGSGSARILTSADGLSWTDVSPAVSSDLLAVAHGNGVWLAVGGYYANFSNRTTILRSTDRINWSDVSANSPDTYDKGMAVAYSGSDFVLAKGSSGSSTLFTTPDGLTWTTVTLPNGVISGFNGRAFALGADTLVGVGEGGFTSVGVIQSSNSLRSRKGGSRDNPFTLFDSDDQPPSRVGLPVYRVNTAALNLVVEGSLFYMKTRGVPLDLRLTFNASPDALPGMFGKGWNFSHVASLHWGRATATLDTGAGKPLRYTAPSPLAGAAADNPIELTPPLGNFDSLTCYGDHWVLVEKRSRRSFRFDAGTAAGTAYLTSITDRNGNVVTLDVDLTSGHLTAIHDPAGRDILFAYDGQRCTRITVPDGRTLLFGYDSGGLLASITDMNGHRAGYLYDGDGFMTKMTVDGRATSFSYQARPGDSSDKCVAGVDDPVNGLTAYAFLPNSNSRVRRTSAKGTVTELKAQDGSTATITDPLGALRSISYVNGLPAVFTNANNRKASFTYDDRGNLTGVSDQLANKTTFVYDGSDRLVRRTDPLGNNFDYGYDGAGNLTAVTTPVGNITRFSYDGQGRLLSYTDANANVTAFGSDAFGNMTRVTDPLGNATAFTFDAHGLRCLKVTDARGNDKTFAYDGNDRLTRVGYPFPTGEERSVRNTYDAFGQTSFIDEQGAVTTFERNMLGFITRTVDPLRAVSSFEFDPANNLVRTVDPLGRSTAYSFDESDRLTGSTDPLGGNMGRSYDAEGNLTSMTNRRGKATSYTYDNAGRLKSIRYPGASSSISYTRDKLGRVASITNGRGVVIAFSHDADGRMTGKSYDSVQQAAFTSDAAGNLTSVTDAAGTTSYSYNERNEVVGITYPDGKQLAFSYDPVGNLAGLHYPDGTRVTVTYDTLNRLRPPRSLRNAANSEVGIKPEKRNQVISLSWGDGAMTFDYDAVAELVRETRSNGVITDYQRDGGRRLTAIRHRRQGGAEFASFVASYDAAGNCLSEEASGTPSPPLPAPVAAITYNDLDQIVNWGGSPCTYDADGNLAGFAGMTGAYDAESRLTSLTRGDGTTNFTYDGNGELILVAGPARTVRYYRDRRGRLLFEADANGTVLANYIYAGARLVARGTKAAGYRFYHYDRIGSTVALTDGSGNVAARYAYTPYGEKSVDGDGGDNPCTYAGAYGVLDYGDGLYFMKNRFYDARLGRFLQRDPTGYDGGLNLYEYVGGNPVNRIDPAGTGWLGWIGEAYHYAKKTDEALSRKKAREANIAKKGILRAAEDGDVDADREARGRNAVELGKDGAKLGFDAAVNTTVTGVNTLVGGGILGGVAMSEAVRRFEKGGRAGKGEEPPPVQIEPVPDSSDTADQQAPIQHVEEMDWSRLDNPAGGE
ncbi:MAG: RHS repeat-associated core domain-containing protein [Thermodesulfobacteriota bacterium]